MTPVKLSMHSSHIIFKYVYLYNIYSPSRVLDDDIPGAFPTTAIPSRPPTFSGNRTRAQGAADAGGRPRPIHNTHKSYLFKEVHVLVQLVLAVAWRVALGQMFTTCRVLNPKTL